MTTITGPFNVNNNLEEQVSASMETFVSAGGTPLRAGNSAAAMWPLIQVAQGVIGAGTKNPIAVPPGADILGFRIHTTTTPGSAADHTIRIGTSADSDLYGSITYTGALSKPLGNNDITVSAGAGDNWQAITNTPIIPDVTASGSADATFAGICYVDYKVP